MPAKATSGMTIDDLIASGAVQEHKTGGSITGLPSNAPGSRSLTVRRPLSAEEKKAWQDYQDAVRRGRAR